MLTEQSFIGKAVSALLRDGFSIELSQKTRRTKYGGSFDADNKKFFVDFAGEGGFEVFVHEYCHYLQYKYYNIWGDSQVSLGRFFSWLNGEDWSASTIYKDFKTTLYLEWDCEHKAAKIFGRNNFSLKKEEYCQQANLYLCCYYYIKKYRKWPTTTLTNGSEDILQCLPNKILPFESYLKPRYWSKELQLHFHERIFRLG